MLLYTKYVCSLHTHISYVVLYYVIFIISYYTFVYYTHYTHTYGQQPSELYSVLEYCSDDAQRTMRGRGSNMGLISKVCISALRTLSYLSSPNRGFPQKWSLELTFKSLSYFFILAHSHFFSLTEILSLCIYKKIYINIIEITHDIISIFLLIGRFVFCSPDDGRWDSYCLLSLMNFIVSLLFYLL